MTFEEWFDEIEGYALRCERFYDDLDRLQQFNNGDYVPGDPTYQDIVGWLKAAYETGYEHRNIELMDDGK